MNSKKLCLLALLGAALLPNIANGELKRTPVAPTRIVWMSDTTGEYIKNPEILMNDFKGQVSVADNNCTVLRSNGSHQAAVLLDFGKELHGGIKISSGMRNSSRPLRLRVRLGESVSEAMSDVAPYHNPNNATNEHAMRDFDIQVPWLGSLECGNSGFRFVRIDLLDKDVDYLLRNVQAISVMIDDPEIGSFKCSDERLNKIWETGAYTVKLNMQDYLWDGIKRDRLVWLGDLHPEVMTVSNVWGKHDVVRRTLDFAKADTPLPGWMNGFSSYSMWWLLIHRDYYLHHGDMAYLKDNRDYILGLVKQLDECVDANGEEQMTGVRFLDWPTSEMPDVIHDGLQSLTYMTLDAARQIAGWLDDKEMDAVASKCMERMDKFNIKRTDASQAVSLCLLSGLSKDRQKDCGKLLDNGINSFSPFYGYYAVEALAENGHIDKAMDMISDYWGAMIDLGGTTFWEDLNYPDTKNAARIDEIVPDGKYDIHSQGGAYCYVGLRLSMCHGWGAGPTPWLQRHVLGVKPVEPGCKTIEVKPNLGNLAFAEGTVPTPYGPVSVKARKDESGKTVVSVKAPKGVKVNK
ncbi:alpha-L-rhamnosidase C-terminal domain-containing protein [uncultured Duncaniella sp.]|uniref:alpha-L-rhamnosidase-related protein n=1 Tax=uncultured Duncaniella sp. TaxID=2768039 RepID=UPI0025E80277|nr:alpha-L-rhamnosidase C-terminal domain-containing protein [uncultured Duncaniella sp.]